MIDWGIFPRGHSAQIYLPAVQSSDIIATADRLYAGHRLTRLDDHTVGCETGGVTYVPIPPGGTINYAGLLSVDVPNAVKQGQVLDVVVRQLTNTSGRRPAPTPPPPQIQARRVAAAPPRPLRPGELPAVIAAETPPLVADAAVEDLIRWRRVRRLPARHPGQGPLHPSSERRARSLRPALDRQGDPAAKPLVSRLPALSRRDRRPRLRLRRQPGADHALANRRRRAQTPAQRRRPLLHGQDRRPDLRPVRRLQGFILQTEHASHKFRSRERDIKNLVETAWRERLRLTVCTKPGDPHCPASIILCEPPTPISTCE